VEEPDPEALVARGEAVAQEVPEIQMAVQEPVVLAVIADTAEGMAEKVRYITK
jgi:hypothetical protein